MVVSQTLFHPRKHEMAYCWSQGYIPQLYGIDYRHWRRHWKNHFFLDPGGTIVVTVSPRPRFLCPGKSWPIIDCACLVFPESLNHPRDAIKCLPFFCFCGIRALPTSKIFRIIFSLRVSSGIKTNAEVLERGNLISLKLTAMHVSNCDIRWETSIKSSKVLRSLSLVAAADYIYTSIQYCCEVWCLRVT